MQSDTSNSGKHTDQSYPRVWSLMVPPLAQAEELQQGDTEKQKHLSTHVAYCLT